jgi:hypothetical protein
LASRLLIALVLLMVPAAAQANVTAVSVSPTKISIPTKGTASISVTWSVTDNGGGGGTFNITSSEASIFINGTRIGAAAGNLSRSVTLGVGEVSILTFSETLTISPSLARKLINAPAGSATIRRVFTDGGGTQLADISVNTGNAGPLAVRRIELKFENDARTDVVKQDDIIRAVADVSFRSNGLLRGEWRIVDPTASLGGSTSGRRVLQVVRQQLVSSGEGRTRIVSPPLPTKTNGLYLVSFSVEDTDGNITVPILRYFVLEGHDNAPPTNLSVLTPGDNANIDPESVFSWKPLSGAQAYQLEILEPGSENPITGKIVPGTDLKLSLNVLVFEDLMSGKTYDWRVRAFANGKIIGQSERMSLHIP